MNIAPVHMIRKADAVHSDAHGAGSARTEPQPNARALDVRQLALDSRQLGVLDWHLLSRSRLFSAQCRNADRCHRGAARHATHDVGAPGNSFAGWALAASGLLPPPKGDTETYKFGCGCQVDESHAAIWQRDFDGVGAAADWHRDAAAFKGHRDFAHL
mmetsp:Transcript_5201/g.18946  ORF Transcript_5201/g.18946 Transcript_5201/m.18946 type:complete len:158 (+) Transcript_5201:482-955(+)